MSSVSSVSRGRLARPTPAWRVARAADLVDAARGRPVDRVTARAGVIHDETRLFHVALTRARHEVAVTAVRSEDLQPSPYLDVVIRVPSRVSHASRQRVDAPSVLAGLVGNCVRPWWAPTRRTRQGQLPRHSRAGWRSRCRPGELVAAGRGQRHQGHDAHPGRRCASRRPVSTDSPKCQLQWFLAGSGARARRWAPARSVRSSTR